MKLLRLIIDSENVLDTFSPVEIVQELMKQCKGKGELPVDVYETEVK